MAATEVQLATLDEEAQIEALLLSQGLQTAPTAAQPRANPTCVEDESCAGVNTKRDLYVLDAACGGRASWSTEMTLSEIDFAEERDNGWAACVSIIMSLFAVDADNTRTHMHDETGTGRADQQASELAASTLAEERAISSARRRLAKRFAHSIDRQTLAAIEQAIQPVRKQGQGWGSSWKRR